MTPPRSHALVTGLLAAGLAAGLACAAEAPVASTPAPAPPRTTVAQSPKPSVSTQAPISANQVPTAPAPRAEALPTWTKMTPAQQAALAPLSGTWRRELRWARGRGRVEVVGAEGGRAARLGGTL